MGADPRNPIRATWALPGVRKQVFACPEETGDFPGPIEFSSGLFGATVPPGTRAVLIKLFYFVCMCMNTPTKGRVPQGHMFVFGAR